MESMKNTIVSKVSDGELKNYIIEDHSNDIPDEILFKQARRIRTFGSKIIGS